MGIPHTMQPGTEPRQLAKYGLKQSPFNDDTILKDTQLKQTIVS